MKGRAILTNETFEQVIANRMSRRSFLGGTIGAAAALASLGGIGSLMSAVPVQARGGGSTLLQWGMHNDGIVYFPINGSARGLIVQNNEYTDDVLLFTDGTAGWNAAKTAKSQNAHGVSIIEVTKQGRGKPAGSSGGEWRVVRPSNYARRITGQTPIDNRRPGCW
jgi:secreted PhoX family phosphatase